MTLNLTISNEEPDLKPRITVFGVGGAGGNAVNNMIEQQLEGCEFVTANTDAQALAQSKAAARIQMGARVTEGLGAGARPAVGASAAEESIEEIIDHLAGAHMCFITAGMGGGTGTGAAPIIAQAARELGVLTVGVVTKPFQFEGAKRMRQADDGIEALQRVVDTLIIIPNQNLFRLANEKTTFTEAFALADDVLYQGVKGVTDLMVRPGLINLDFADVRAVMNEMGKAMMGTGEAEGEARAVNAADKAIANPLLDEISLRGARGVLINITGGYDLTLFELDEAANRIREEVDAEANIIVGSTLDTGMEGKMRVSVVATGIDAAEVEVPLGASAGANAGADIAVAAMAAAARSEAEAVPEPAYVAPVEEEPNLFEGIDHEPVAVEPFQPMAEPAPEPVAVNPARVAAEAEGAAYRGAPQPAAHQSPENLARLRAAIQKTPPAAQAHPQAAAQAEQDAQGKGGRFGINSLINRMTGHGEDQSPVHQPAARRVPPVSAQHPAPMEDRAVDPDQERIEIPAFLRRQAN